MELAAILVGLAVAVIYYWQLDTMQGQLREMKGSGAQTDQMLCLIRQQLEQITKQATDTHELALQAKNQADRTKDVADSALLQANATNKLAIQAKRSADASQIDIRAWIQPTFHSEFFPVRPKSEYSEPFGFINVGKSPASNIHANVVIEFLYPGDSLEFDYTKMMRFAEVGLLFPNSSRETTIPASEIGPDGKPRNAIVTPAFSASFEAGAAYVVMYGKITYHDKLGDHWTTFCSLRSIIKAALFSKEAVDRFAGKCSAYNQTD